MYRWTKQRREDLAKQLNESARTIRSIAVAPHLKPSPWDSEGALLSGIDRLDVFGSAIRLGICSLCPGDASTCETCRGWLSEAEKDAAIIEATALSIVGGSVPIEMIQNATSRIATFYTRRVLASASKTLERIEQTGTESEP